MTYSLFRLHILSKVVSIIIHVASFAEFFFLKHRK